ncbi:nuclear transport factor 2 family protein [Thalassotalea sp. ND16A]|uniref:nuclear transport factor 2 family protein n=1 Tax=Thalassotalea sp. ND16A TaxID=1535422 RepID=UPI00051A6354|nr:nuclear transport factor 2 family protein [Thalassotalea sp. ND16A]KGJ93360.1 hypothetical protein ND16A_1518 [Thalassotalea sp. ND16A]
MEFLREYEVMLHQFDVRKNVEQLKTLLHPDLIEIGYSGKTFDFDMTVRELPLEKKPDHRVWSQDFEYIELATNLAQLIYREARMDIHGNLSRHAKRSSIWVRDNGQWKMRFHQGTPTAAFEKAQT